MMQEILDLAMEIRQTDEPVVGQRGGQVGYWGVASLLPWPSPFSCHRFYTKVVLGEQSGRTWRREGGGREGKGLKISSWKEKGMPLLSLLSQVFLHKHCL